MLLILMFHQIHNPNHPDRLLQFKSYLDYLCSHSFITTPGGALSKTQLNIALCFDDAYYDFYYHVFPLLKQKQLKATLAIPTQFIQESTDVSPQIRLNVPYPAGLEPTMQKNSPLCTWAELREMTQTGLVIPAAHSHTHCDLTHPQCDLEQETQGAQARLVEQLNLPCQTFVYPFGRMTKTVHHHIKPYFKYLFRIGSSSNQHWTPKSKLLYRIDADPFWHHNRPFTPKDRLLFYSKWILNQIRGK